MTWLAFVAGAVLSWGVYGAMLHQGQVRLGSPMRALLCVGVAYFLVGVVVPVITLFAQGQGLRGFTAAGTSAATIAGTLGALGAVCIIFSFRTGGTPTYVMPLVFGGAPLVNVLYTMATHPPKTAPSPMLYVGFLVTAIGAGMVLYFKPRLEIQHHVLRATVLRCNVLARATCDVLVPRAGPAVRTARGKSHAAGGTTRRRCTARRTAHVASRTVHIARGTSTSPVARAST